MADQVQLRGGSTSQNNGFTGAPRELSVDTTKNTVRVHDGATAGGHELAKSAEVLPLTGGTLTGDLVVPSLNGGQLAGFRNIIINGDLAINQRGADIASVSTGEYGQDRWKKTAGGMTQIIEDGNFEPGATYTLSGTNAAPQQLTAPASGAWTLPDIPITARKIQLELGTVATPFERRSNGIELALCQRYYQGVDGAYRFDGICGAGGTITVGHMWYFPVRMRATPTLTTGAESGTKSGTISWIPKSTSGAMGYWQWQDTAIATDRTKAAVVLADAEL